MSRASCIQVFILIESCFKNKRTKNCQRLLTERTSSSKGCHHNDNDHDNCTDFFSLHARSQTDFFQFIATPTMPPSAVAD